MRRQPNNADVDQQRLLRAHFRSVGCGTQQQYLDWCTEHGFPRRLAKHPKQREREVSFAQQAAAKQRLRKMKRESRDPLETVKAICEGRVRERDVTQPHLARLCHAVQTLGGRKGVRRHHLDALQQLVGQAARCRAKFFDASPAIAERGPMQGNTYLEALVLVAANRTAWLRPVGDWRPTTKNARRQFGSLLRHLFVRYDDMPRFFDRVWFETTADDTQRYWYLHVGRGQSIRTCRLPIPCTKKMAHHFLQAPHDATVDQALRWGQVHALGGDERLARAVFGTRLGTGFENDSFWETVLRWLVEHPMFDRAHVGPIVDYLHHQRFVSERVFVAAGVREETPPPQPNLSMRGRSPDSLLRQVNAWHRRLANDNTQQLRQWSPSGFAGLEFAEGSRDSGNLRIWTVRELLGSKALYAEGRQMKHCVGSYASSCARGHCSIWTMEVESSDGTAKVLTLEVLNNVRTICQARGKLNRLPTEKERKVLTRWATAAGLRIASYV